MGDGRQFISTNTSSLTMWRSACRLKKHDAASCQHGGETLERKGTEITGISVCAHVCVYRNVKTVSCNNPFTH